MCCVPCLSSTLMHSRALLQFQLRRIRPYPCSIELFCLPTMFVGKVINSVISVLTFWTAWPSTLSFCLYFGHGHSSLGIDRSQSTAVFLAYHILRWASVLFGQEIAFWHCIKRKYQLICKFYSVLVIILLITNLLSCFIIFTMLWSCAFSYTLWCNIC